MWHNKIIPSTDIPESKIMEIYNYLERIGQSELLEDNWMYVDIDRSNVDVSFMFFKNSKVYSLAKRHGLTASMAVQYCYQSWDFFQELREIQYWLDIGDFEKYMPCTGEIITVDGVESIVEDEYIIAKSESEAAGIFKYLGYKDLLYVVNVDE